MSTTIDSKITTVSLRNQGLFGMPGFGTTKYKYFSELSIIGKKPNRTFSVDLYRIEDGITQRVAFRNNVGRLDQVLIEGIYQSNEQERALYLSIDKQTKLSTSYWEGLIGNNGLETLTAQEKSRLAIATGNNNEALNSNTAGAVFVGGGTGTDADGTTAVEQTQGATTVTDQVVLSEIDFKGVNINIEGRNFRDGYQDLSYPEGLGSNRQDRVRFEQIYSSWRKIAAGKNLTDQIFQRSTQRITGAVTLPIVTGIEDTNQVDWQGASLNPLQAVGASGALDIFQKARETRGLGAAFRDAAGATQEAIGRMRQPDSTVGSDINTAINVYLAQKAVGAQGLLSRTTGAILNPNLEMLFNGPSLRQFPFTFKLSARDAEEADQIRKIIRFFKQGMSVKTSSSNVFLKSPNIFRISYQTFNTDGDEIVHPSLNIIKDCALLSCNVQYTPDGTYMTYDDPFRTMTSYQLTLAFGELDPIFDDDYTDLDDNNDQVIGY